MKNSRIIKFKNFELIGFNKVVLTIPVSPITERFTKLLLSIEENIFS